MIMCVCDSKVTNSNKSFECLEKKEEIGKLARAHTILTHTNCTILLDSIENGYNFCAR